MNDLITIDDAASRLGVHPGTVREWVRTGRVPCYRVGTQFVRLSWLELMSAMAQERQSPAAPQAVAERGERGGAGTRPSSKEVAS